MVTKCGPGNQTDICGGFVFWKRSLLVRTAFNCTYHNEIKPTRQLQMTCHEGRHGIEAGVGGWDGENSKASLKDQTNPLTLGFGSPGLLKSAWKDGGDEKTGVCWGSKCLP